jgi:hypothetical protein
VPESPATRFDAKSQLLECPRRGLRQVERHVITERARGRSIGELLRERSRFELEDVLRLMTPLAGSLDLAAALTCCPNPIPLLAVHRNEALVCS